MQCTVLEEVKLSLIGRDHTRLLKGNSVPLIRPLFQLLCIPTCNILLLYIAKYLMAINLVQFAVSLQKVKIISAKMNGQLVMWQDYACNPPI